MFVPLGDPTNTGTGGESIWGKPFKDEVHGRIRFNHRGQVAMANSNRPNSNGSQFFITLDNCDWLNGKHTIFGKVAGNTMFNVLRMGETEVNNETEKPSDPIELLSVNVINNPFPEIIPRK
jgi:peptidyl-prolyl cis-trans isomerase SDCCAG10